MRDDRPGDIADACEDATPARRSMPTTATAAPRVPRSAWWIADTWAAGPRLGSRSKHRTAARAASAALSPCPSPSAIIR